MLTRLWRSLRRRLRDDRGSSAVEYSMIIAGIAALIVVAVASMGSVVSAAYKSYCDRYSAAANLGSTCGAPSTPAPPPPPGHDDDDDDDDDGHGHD